MQFAGSGQSNARARHAKWMTQGNRAPIGIDSFIAIVQAHGAGTCQGLRSKGLIKLYDIYVIELQSRFGESYFAGGHRANAHDSGLDASNSAGYNTG
jgi:hypothetical protein